MIAGKFKREDLARSLLNFFVLDLVQCVQLICSCHDIKRIFFCGSFGCTPLVRRLITTEFVRRNLYLMSFVKVTHLSVFVLLAVIDFTTSVCNHNNNNNNNNDNCWLSLYNIHSISKDFVFRYVYGSLPDRVSTSVNIVHELKSAGIECLCSDWIA